MLEFSHRKVCTHTHACRLWQATAATHWQTCTDVHTRRLAFFFFSLKPLQKLGTSARIHTHTHTTSQGKAPRLCQTAAQRLRRCCCRFMIAGTECWQKHILISFLLPLITLVCLFACLLHQLPPKTRGCTSCLRKIDIFFQQLNIGGRLLSCFGFFSPIYVIGLEEENGGPGISGKTTQKRRRKEVGCLMSSTQKKKIIFFSFFCRCLPPTPPSKTLPSKTGGMKEEEGATVMDVDVGCVRVCASRRGLLESVTESSSSGTHCHI